MTTTTKQNPNIMNGNKPKKVFVSLPITGREEAARQEARMAKERLVEQGYEVVTPFECAPEPGRHIGYYIGRCIEALLQCDAICQKPRSESAGCRLESCATSLYNLQRISWPLENPQV